MRRNKWMPRKIGKTPEGPRTIQQVREDAYRDGCIYMPQQSPPNSSGLKTGTSLSSGAGGPGGFGGYGGFLNPLEGNFFEGKPKGKGGKGGGGLGDLFGGYGGGLGGGSTGGSYLGTGPGVIQTEGFGEPRDSPPYEGGRGSGGGGVNNGFHNNGDSVSNNRNSGGGGYDGGRGDQQHYNKHERSPPHGGDRPPRQQQQHPMMDERGDRDRDGYYDTASYNDRERRGGGGANFSNFHQRDRDRGGGDRGGDRGGGFDRGGPPQDFGDRYSANRSKDRDRRQQFQPQRNGGGPPHDNNGRFGGGGGKFGGDRYDNRGGFGNRNSGGGPGGPGGPPPRDGMMRSDGGNYHADEPGNNLPPRFKRMAMNSEGGGGGDRRPPHHRDDGPPRHPASSGGPPAGVLGPDGGQISPPPGGGQKRDGGDVSLRPQSASNMLFKPKTPSTLPKSAIRGQESSPLGENSLLGPPLPAAPAVVMMQQKEAPIVIVKQASLDGKGRHGRGDKGKGGGQGSKGPTREEVFARVEAILAELLEHKSAESAAESWKEKPEDGSSHWLPAKMSQTAATHLFKQALSKKEKESERELALSLAAQLVKEGSLNATHCQEALAKVLSSHLGEVDKAFEGEEGAGKRRVAEAAAWLVQQELLTFKELCELCRGPAQHPTFLLSLAELREAWGEDKLKGAFDETKPKMPDHVDLKKDGEEGEGEEDALFSALDSHGLSFLLPLLGARREMARRLAEDPSDAAAFAKWLREDEGMARFHGRPDFVTALFKVALRHIAAPAPASPSEQPDKAATEAEREALDRFRPVLQPFVRERGDLQLAAVYALQVFCFERGYPKGLLLRSFVNFYELDILDEGAFLRWKEDVNDEYPGKGKALFQVRSIPLFA